MYIQSNNAHAIRLQLKLQELAKTMRKNPTTAEAKLWPYLRAKRMKGLKFRRQHPLFHFIVDFFCYEQKIIIEVDGSVHEYQFQHDKMRDELFRNKGYDYTTIF